MIIIGGIIYSLYYIADKYSLIGRVLNCGFNGCGFESHCLSIKKTIEFFTQLKNLS